MIGARAPLIAFNVYLTTNEVSIAQRIASSHGGELLLHNREGGGLRVSVLLPR